MSVLGPPRLRDQPGDLSDAERAELFAYELDAPSRETQARMLTRLTGALEKEAPAQLSLRARFGARRLAFGVVLLGVMAGLLMFATSPKRASVPAPAPSAAQPQAVPVQLRPELPTVAPVATTEAEQTAAPVSVPHPNRRAARVSAPGVQGRPALAELELLLRARRVLPSGPARALALTVEHARLYPRGSLVEERETLAIEALVKLGQDEPARARARHFLRLFPRSSQCARLRDWLASDRASP